MFQHMTLPWVISAIGVERRDIGFSFALRMTTPISIISLE
jgi:hypothetical protein